MRKIPQINVTKLWENWEILGKFLGKFWENFGKFFVDFLGKGKARFNIFQ